MTTGARHAWIVVATLAGACATPPVSGDDDDRTNVPSTNADCDALAGPPCGDVDADGLTDAWEDVVLDRLRPVVRFDEDESLLTDPGAIVADIGRVAPIAGGALVFVVIAYSKDYGSCGVSGHDGDPERVVLRVVALDGVGPGDVIVADAYTAAPSRRSLACRRAVRPTTSPTRPPTISCRRCSTPGRTAHDGSKTWRPSDSRAMTPGRIRASAAARATAAARPRSATSC